MITSLIYIRDVDMLELPGDEWIICGVSEAHPNDDIVFYCGVSLSDTISKTFTYDISLAKKFNTHTKAENEYDTVAFFLHSIEKSYTFFIELTPESRYARQ